MSESGLSLSRQGFWLLAGLCGLLLACQLLQPWLAFERDAIHDGQVWRLLTGHLTHAGWRHLALNLLGAVLLVGLFRHSLSPWRWLVALLLMALATSAGLWLGQPRLQCYVGLSGVLHGVLVVGLGREVVHGERFPRLVALLLAAKLAVECTHGPLTPAALIGVPVIPVAHLYGALGGLLAALLLIRPAPSCRGAQVAGLWRDRRDGQASTTAPMPSGARPIAFAKRHAGLLGDSPRRGGACLCGSEAALSGHCVELLDAAQDR